MTVPCVSGIREDLPLNFAERKNLLSDYPYQTFSGTQR